MFLKNTKNFRWEFLKKLKKKKKATNLNLWLFSGKKLIFHLQILQLFISNKKKSIHSNSVHFSSSIYFSTQFFIRKIVFSFTQTSFLKKYPPRGPPQHLQEKERKNKRIYIMKVPLLAAFLFISFAICFPMAINTFANTKIPSIKGSTTALEPRDEGPPSVAPKVCYSPIWTFFPPFPSCPIISFPLHVRPQRDLNKNIFFLPFLFFPGIGWNYLQLNQKNLLPTSRHQSYSRRNWLPLGSRRTLDCQTLRYYST